MENTLEVVRDLGLDPKVKVLLSLNRRLSDSFGIVVYVRLGNQCVFSGVTTETNSTINLAEHIIAAIAESEEVDPSLLHFFDLQTYRGYARGGDRWRPGIFEFSRLVIEMRARMPVVLGWEPVRCSDKIVRLFAPLIGPNSRQRDTPEA